MLVKSVVILYCVLFILLPIYSKVTKVKQLSVNSCIEVWMTKHSYEEEEEWYVYAGNKCWDSLEFPYNIRIKKAYNITLDSGLILETQGFIIPARDKKLIFMSSRLSSDRHSILSWDLVD